MAPRFDAIGVVSRDMPQTLSFYRRLGLDLPDSADGEPHVEVALPGGLRLMFDTEDVVRAFDPSWTPPAERGRIGVAFLCDNTAEVDRIHRALVAAGHPSHLAPFDAFWGQRYASVVDPDGTIVDLFAPLDPDTNPTVATAPA